MSNVLEVIRTAEEHGPPPDEGAALVPPDWIDDDDPEVRGPWKIQNLPSASWSLSRVAELEAQIASVEAVQRD